MTATVRDRPDACPGALRTHRAADGLLVRLRLPGGRLLSSSARGLADLAERHADRAVYLTSRGNIQLRGVREVNDGADPALVAGVRGCGLLPSPTHELVRNIVASPWSGRRGGLVDVGPVVTAVDAALCAEPALAALPGRFLVSVDDGTGDVAALDADITWWAQDADRGALLVGGHDTGRRVPRDAVGPAVAHVAHEFLRARAAAGGTAWHVTELPGGAARFAQSLRLGQALPDARTAERTLRYSARSATGTAAGLPSKVESGADTGAGSLQPPEPTPGLPELGAVTQTDGAWGVAALVPLGRLDVAAMHLLADAAELASGLIVVTPWREVVLQDVAPERLAEVHGLVAAAGLVTDGESPWRRVTACVGRPSCARALADVRSLAADTVAAMASTPDATPARLHFSGCERRCGRPASAHREVVAEPAGCSVADVGPASEQRTRHEVMGPDACLNPATVAALTEA